MHGMRPNCKNCPMRQGSICGALSNEALAELGKISRKRELGAHQAIFHDGDASDHYYNITSGVVKLVKTLADGHQHIVGLLYPPSFVGQSLNRTHTYSAEAATDVELCYFPRGPFEAFLDRHPELERRIFQMTVRELDVCRDWMLLLGRKSAYERVAGFVLMMALRMPHAGCDEKASNQAHFRLPFTRSEMADYLGLTLETVSRQFSRLKRKEIIALPTSRDVVVPNLELLGAVAQVETCSNEFDVGQSRAIA